MKQVNLKNVRNHTNTTLVPNKINLIYGANASGKTSILNAIELALTGKCAGDDFSKHSSHSSVAAVVTDSGTEFSVCRKKGNPMYKVNGKTVTLGALHQSVFEDTGWKNEDIEIMMSDFFDRMTEKQRRDYLLKACNIVFDEATIYDALSDKGNHSKAVQKLMNKIAGNSYSYDDMDVLLKFFSDERKSVNAQLDSQEKFKASLSSSSVSSSSREEKEIGKERQDLEESLKKLEADIAVIRERKSQEKAAKDQVTSLQNQIANIPLSGSSLSNSVSEEEVEKDEKKLSTLRQEAIKYKTELEVLNPQIASLKAQKTCPLSSALVCTADRSSLIEKLTKRKQELEKSLDDVCKKGVALDGEIREKKKVLKTIQSEKLAAEKRNFFEERLKLAQEELSKIQVPDDGMLKAERDALLVRKSGLDKEYNGMIEAKAFAKKAESLDQEIAALKERKEQLEYIVSELKPSGVRARVFGKIFAPIEAKMNEALALLSPGYQIKVSVEETGLTTQITTDTGATVLYDFLSVSEKFRIGVIIKHAINAINGFGLLIIDGADVLDHNNLLGLFNFLETVSDCYENIFVTITSEKAMNVAEKSISSYFVENGNLKLC